MWLLACVGKNGMKYLTSVCPFSATSIPLLQTLKLKFRLPIFLYDFFD
jgi:hypothetical protein